MSEKHTEEPWRQYIGDPIVITDSEGGSIGEMSAGFPGITTQEMMNNARRAVASVNFTTGFSTEALEATTLAELVEGYRKLVATLSLVTVGTPRTDCLFLYYEARDESRSLLSKLGDGQ